jgi:hypothetical protein
MNDNPYAPPSTKVEDVDGGVPMERPREVKLAITLFWISVVVALPVWFDLGEVDPGDPDQFTPWVFGVVFAVAMMAFTVWVIVSIGRARNWARITYLVLASLGWIFMLMDVPGMYSRSWYYGAANLFNAVCDLGIVVLLFMRASNAWFRAHGRRPADAPT